MSKLPLKNARIHRVIIGTIPNLLNTRRVKAETLAANVRSFTQGTATRRTRRQKDNEHPTRHLLRWCAMLKSWDVYLSEVTHCQKERPDLWT